mmetsp:Transcript_24484/g.59563  ORF Transcript_24484/g.59563 Transcript_24484/m.59563 type:complete len:262 (+) Transcript_24484:82-867(+)
MESEALTAGWAWMLGNLSEFQITTVATFVLHELFYWAAYVPFLVADRVPAMRRWKIQPDKESNAATQWQCFRRVMLSHMFIVAPLVALTHFVKGGFPMSLPLPPWQTSVFQVIAMFVIEDFFFYWGHRLLHTPWLYRNIHSIHHEFSSPIGMAAEYAHPAEVVFLGIATGIGPLVFGPHLFTLWCYLCVRCFQTVECHSGYDFPWSLNRWVPVYGGADFHDHHHKNYSGNYASTFIWMDAVYGTDAAYQQWKAKQTANKAS